MKVTFWVVTLVIQLPFLDTALLVEIDSAALRE